MNDLNLHIQESEQNLSGIASKKSILGYIKISLWKLNMKKKLESNQREMIHYLSIELNSNFNWTSIQMTMNFSSET